VGVALAATRWAPHQRRGLREKASRLKPLLQKRGPRLWVASVTPRRRASPGTGGPFRAAPLRRAAPSARRPPPARASAPGADRAIPECAAARRRRSPPRAEG